MADGHGGKRAGAGRKAGALTTKTREIAETASKEGKTPLEVMLENMRHFQRVAVSAELAIEQLSVEKFADGETKPEDQFKVLLAEVRKAAGFRQMAHECAKDAAPYMHPRLASVEHNGGGKPIEVIIRGDDAEL